MYCTVDKATEEKNLGSEKKTTFVPPVNQYKSDSGIILIMDFPGVSEDKVEISFEKDNLIINAESDFMISDEYKLTREEYSLGKYSRRFFVGDRFDQEKTKAVFKNGRLTLTLQYSEILSKKIEIKSE